MIGVPLYDLLYEIRMCGFQVRTGGLIEFKLKAPPQLWHMESLVPATANLGGKGAIQQWQKLKDVKQNLLGQLSPVGHQIS